MELALIQTSLRIGYVWILLNLAAISFFAALFLFEQVRKVIRSRRLTALPRRGVIVCIRPR